MIGLFFGLVWWFQPVDGMMQPAPVWFQLV